MEEITSLINALSKQDLGSAALSLAVGFGLLLVAATIFRSIEIPIRIFLEKRNK